MKVQFCLKAFLSGLVPLLWLTVGCGTTRPEGADATAIAAATVESVRPSAWAQPLSVDGLPNLHQVNDVLYRSGQPTADGYVAARRLGIRSVLRLRAAHVRDESAVTAGLTVYNVPFQAWGVNDDIVVQAMRILRQAEQDGPFLVHCLHGSDRTGLVVAIYRMLFENWTVTEAVTELTEGGFGFHPIFVNIPHYLHNLNLEELRVRVLE